MSIKEKVLKDAKKSYRPAKKVTRLRYKKSS